MRHYFINEKGRSMAEMIAVLCVIGLLSIGTLLAYEQGIGLYLSGQIQDALLKAKTLAKMNTSEAQAREVRRSLKQAFTRYTVAVKTQEENLNRQYTVEIGMVSPRVCSMVLAKKEALESQKITISEPTTQADCYLAPSVQLTFTFSAY